MKYLGIGVMVLLLACGMDNFGPEACSQPEPMLLEVNEVASQVLCFTDPEDDELTLSAMSSDETVVSVQILGMTVSVTALSGGEALITVTASDTEGLTADVSFSVTIAAPAMPEVLLTDDFSTLTNGWAKRFVAEADVEEGRLWISSDDKSVIANVRHSVGPGSDPRVRTRLENSTDDMWSTIIIGTTDERAKALAFLIGANAKRMSADPDNTPTTNFVSLLYDELGPQGAGWYLLVGGEFSSILGPGEPMEVEVAIDTHIRVIVNGSQIVREVRDSLIPATIQSIGLGATWPEDVDAYTEARVYFDSVEVVGTPFI